MFLSTVLNFGRFGRSIDESGLSYYSDGRIRRNRKLKKPSMVID